MLLQFSIQNYRSIKDKQTLSFEATGDTHLEESRVANIAGTRILKSCAVYGANGSGKSNLLRAFSALRNHVISSAREGQATDEIPVKPFLLHDDTAEGPTTAEWIFFLDGVRFRYGFTADATEVKAEWLFRKRTGKEAKLFTRENQEIDSTSNFPEGHDRRQFVRPNALFLSVCAQLNGEISSGILSWFAQTRYGSGLDDTSHFHLTAIMMEDPDVKQKFLEFAQRADLGITNLESEVRISKNADGKVVRRGWPMEIMTSHPRYATDGTVNGHVKFNLEQQESAGTRKFVSLSGPLYATTIGKGSLFILDEFEARLHPLLTKEIWEWFHARSSDGAQILIATHDVGLMDPEFMRRDQVWFCSKDEQGATSLYSLAEYSSEDVRPTTRFGKHYLQGVFGAVPDLALNRID